MIEKIHSTVQELLHKSYMDRLTDTTKLRQALFTCSLQNVIKTEIHNPNSGDACGLNPKVITTKDKQLS
jgi:hypothetical protein